LRVHLGSLVGRD